MDHIDLVQPYEAPERHIFIDSVGESGHGEVVERDESAAPFHEPYRAEHIIERIPPRPVIPLIIFLARAIHADADRVEPRLAKALDHAGFAGVGVHIDDTIGRFDPDDPDRFLDDASREERFAVAPLPKTYHRAGEMVDVIKRDLRDLFCGGDEGDPRLCFGKLFA